MRPRLRNLGLDTIPLKEITDWETMRLSLLEVPAKVPEEPTLEPKW